MLGDPLLSWPVLRGSDQCSRVCFGAEYIVRLADHHFLDSDRRLIEYLAVTILRWWTQLNGLAASCATSSCAEPCETPPPFTTPNPFALDARFLHSSRCTTHLCSLSKRFVTRSLVRSPANVLFLPTSTPTRPGSSLYPALTTSFLSPAEVVSTFLSIPGCKVLRVTSRLGFQRNGTPSRAKCKQLKSWRVILKN